MMTGQKGEQIGGAEVKRIGVAAVLVALITAASGCGSQPHGPSAAEKAAEARAKAAAQRKAKETQLFKECADTTAPLEKKLSDLNSRVSVGLQFQDYTTRVGTARVAYDGVVKQMKSNGISQRCLTAVGEPLESSLNAFVTAGNTWNKCVTDYNCSLDKGSASLTSMQKSWVKATRMLNKADKGLNTMRPAAS